jgi:16S rRNA (guanine966-N2)-methyltransferase
MRIIAGTHKGRRLLPPPGKETTRPITDRVKEALCSILHQHFQDADVLDLFAGTGSLGIEALSRGAASCLFVEQNRAIARLLQENLDHLGIGSEATVMQADALGSACLARAPRPVHLIFADPPYPLMREESSRRRVLGQLERAGELLDADGFLALRTPSKHLPDLTIPTLDGPETRHYGTMALHLYAPRREG